VYIFIWHMFAVQSQKTGFNMQERGSLLFSSLTIFSCLALVSMSYKAGGTLSHKHCWRISLCNTSHYKLLWTENDC